MTVDGLTAILSAFGPKETMNRLESEVKAKGLTVFARVDHAAGAEAVGLKLRPTELLIFGNARGGTPLMAWRVRFGPANAAALAKLHSGRSLPKLPELNRHPILARTREAQTTQAGRRRTGAAFPWN
jgi:hypothetical protein